jgi:hypothetical protein
MAKYELKTKKNEASVEDFLNTVADESVRADCQTISEMMQKATKAEPKMWGANIVGFGSYQYKNSTGSGYEWMQMGFSPRKQNLTLYLMSGFERYNELMAKLGKHKTGKSCLYLKRLSDVDLDVLQELMNDSTKHLLGRV